MFFMSVVLPSVSTIQCLRQSCLVFRFLIRKGRMGWSKTPSASEGSNWVCIAVLQSCAVAHARIQAECLLSSECNAYRKSDDHFTGGRGPYGGPVHGSIQITTQHQQRCNSKMRE